MTTRLIYCVFALLSLFTISSNGTDIEIDELIGVCEEVIHTIRGPVAITIEKQNGERRRYICIEGPRVLSHFYRETLYNEYTTKTGVGACVTSDDDEHASLVIHFDLSHGSSITLSDV
jgi:hypothetical protein